MTTDGAGRDHETTDGTPRIIAHRGFAGVAPENTLGAFRAIADGTHPAAMVELDVRPCADGTPVVFHDDRLGDGSRGLTDGSGVVWETPRETVRSATVLDSGETVPTFEAALDALPPDVGVNVELKNPGTADVRPGEALDPDEVAARRERWDPFVERVVATLDGAGNEVLVSSFCEPAIASVRDLAPAFATAPLLSRSVESGLTVAERHGCEAVHPSLDLVPGTPYHEPPGGPVGSSAGDVDLLSAAREMGCAVNVWTVRTWHEAHHLRAVGVDGLIADYPGLLACS